jgi:Xaa-Pro aminopeptidase
MRKEACEAPGKLGEEEGRCLSNKRKHNLRRYKMETPHMDLNRARKLMKQEDVDVMVASTVDNFYYASGHRPIIANSHPAITVVPADPSLSPCMIIADFGETMARQQSYIDDIRAYPLWMPIITVDQINNKKTAAKERPHQFSNEEVFGLFSDVVKEIGADNGVIAIEKNFLEIPEVYSVLKKQSPKATFVKAEDLFWELRRIKTEEEIKVLKTAADLAVKGLQAMIHNGVLGASIGELQFRYKKGVLEAATHDLAVELEMGHLGISAGDHFPTLNNPEYRVSKGDIIWEDHGCKVLGYTSDMGRTFCVGKPNEMQKRLFEALREGFEAAASKTRPGVKMKDIYWTLQNTVNQRGFEWYARGHMGHSIGIGPAEQKPFVKKDEETELEPNMVICLECGVYVVGRFGAFQIEDMFLITPDGHEVLTKITRDMVELD